VSIRRSLRWLGRGTLALCAALLGGYAVIHWHTESLLQVNHDMTPVVLPHGDAAEGERLSRILGCQACHGRDLGGALFAEIPLAARLVAPNLTRARMGYDDAAFVRLLRTGAKSDRRLALVMPSKAFQRLDEREIADLLAYLRSVPEVSRDLPATRIWPLGRLGVVLGQYDIEAMRADPPESAPVLADRHHPDRGRRLLLVACAECHGMDLAGFPEEGIPPLRILLAYSASELARLMREGITRSGGESATGFMSAVARNRFAVLSDEELAAMQDYLSQSP